MKSRKFYYLAGFSTAVAIYLILWGFAFITNSLLDDVLGYGDSTVQVLESLESPNANYTATTYTYMGGGAAGWCGKRVTVNSKAFPFSWEKEKERGGYSFEVSCHSNVDLKWEDDRHLMVGYSGSQDKFGIRVSQKPTGFDETVNIHYVAR